MDKEARIKGLYGMDKRAGMLDDFMVWAQENPEEATALGYGAGGGVLGYLAKGLGGVLPGAAIAGGGRYLLGKLLGQQAPEQQSADQPAPPRQLRDDQGYPLTEDGFYDFERADWEAKGRELEAALNKAKLERWRPYQAIKEKLNGFKSTFSSLADAADKNMAETSGRRKLVSGLLANKKIGPDARQGLNDWITTGNEAELPWEFRSLVADRKSRQESAERNSSWNEALEKSVRTQKREDRRAAARGEAASGYAQDTAEVKIPERRRFENPWWVDLLKHRR